MKIGAICLVCGDSRNGSVPKALRKRFRWPSETRVKKIAVAGGAHAGGREIGYSFVVRQVRIYTKVLLERGATNITLFITDHDDCGYCKVFGKKNIRSYWSDKSFLKELYEISDAIKGVKILAVGYHDKRKPSVPSKEITAKVIWEHKRRKKRR
jgi:hypothetical protein